MTDMTPVEQQFDDPTPGPIVDIEAENRALYAAAPETLHELRVVLAAGRGVDLKLRCLGNEDSRCHIYAEEDGGPAAKHEDCAVIPWFDDDHEQFIIDYAGPDAPGLSSGRVIVRSWGEDGIEWEYAAAEATEFAVGSLA